MSVATVGVIGGSGLYDFLDPLESLDIDTPFGRPSDRVTIADVEGHRVAFVPRHGTGHTIAPHLINYRANVWALRELGVTRVIGPCAVGSLKPEHIPGTAVVCDQLIDRTQGRAATYWDGPEVHHLSFADPYCPQLRPLAVTAMEAAGFPTAPAGTIVVIPGPRFSTRAESRWYSAMGCDVVGMSAHPEVALARELGMCYVNVALVTDYDSGLDGHDGIRPVTEAEVFAVFAKNVARLRGGLMALVAAIPEHRTCACASVTTPRRTGC